MNAKDNCSIRVFSHWCACCCSVLLIGSGGYRGVAMVSAETPSEKARAPNQRRLVSRRAKITLKYG